MGISTFLIRSIGVGATALVGYDTLRMSKRRATYQTRQDISDDMTDILMRNISSGNGSELTERMKTSYMKIRMDDNIIPTLQYAKNRVGKTVESLAFNALSLGLAVCAMGAKSTSKLKLYKGFMPNKLAAISAIALGLIGATNVTSNVIGADIN